MNLHLILVHFPIALLSVYAVLQCIRFKRVLAIPSFEEIKLAFLVIGTGGAFLAAASGDSAEHAIALTTALRSLVEIHSNWAGVTEVIFGILTLIHLSRYAHHVAWLSREGGFQKIFNNLLKQIRRFDRPWILISLAVLGLVALTFTGALGGIIAHGASADPITQWVANILGQ